MSDEYPPFHLETTPLRGGTTLVEASAGTGKTYTIAGLVVRLILERNLGIEEILVTTFTDLATAELRDRIRKLLRETLAECERGSDAAARLDLAIRNFDEAPICTIHGFCQRMLRDRAFESGALFDAELVTDDSVLMREVADDFWRTRFYEADEAVAAATMRSGLSSEKLLDLLGTLRNSPAALVLPEMSLADFESLGRMLAERWAELRDNWAGWADEAREIFRDPSSWAKYTHKDPVKMAAYIDALAACVEGASGVKAETESLVFLSASKIGSAVKKGAGGPKHRLFDVCEELLALEKDFGTALRAAFCGWAPGELARRKRERNVLSFDDLLLRLRDALKGEGGEPLAAAIRGRFRAALLDEFQDTDPVQEEIFRRIYTGSDAPVYLIGDPKQAIYGFRGADVFSYLGAAEAADSKHTLGRNWRSETPLVEAVNAVFSVRDAPFVLDGIAFRPVVAEGKADEEPLAVAGKREPPLRIWMLEGGKPLGNGVARPLLAKATAAEIARLLAGPATIGDLPVRPKHIAVLVSDRWEARMVQGALADLRVPSVMSGAEKVFESREAGELRRILAAVAEPARESLIRSALATDALGFTGDKLDAVTRDEPRWEDSLGRFARYHALWKGESFVAMLRTLLHEQDVRARLLAFPDGERRLTNFLHLAELLQQACVEQRLGIGGALKWFGTQTSRPDAARADDFELRLERDDEAVRILTVHKSKGLEFDIVFCPFVWADGKANAETTFHGANGQPTLALGDSAGEHAAEAERERLAERVRLLYVALTRAKHRCTMVWGDFSKGKRSAPAYLFDGDTPARLLERAPSVAVEPVPEGPGPAFAPVGPEPGALHARPFRGAIDRTWGVSSFTGLTRERAHEPVEAEFAEDEPADEAPAADEPLVGIAAFPRGAKPGTCLHGIFEALDFADFDSVPGVVRWKLRAFGIHGHDEAVCDAIRRTLTVPLDASDPEFTLSRVGRSARLAELEFHFPVTRLTAERLSAFPGGGWHLAFPPLNGFLKGFIDLVFERAGRFYIADWKSNWLGPDPDAYTSEAMGAEMRRQTYRLQLHLYAVALHRYLALRLPGYDYDAHFGGVFYAFVRGIDPARPELGIYRERPDASRIGELSEILGGEE